MKAVRVFYESLGEEYVKALNDMIALGAVIFNTDRHYGSHASDKEKLSYLSHENNPIRNEHEETIKRGWLKSHPDRSYHCVRCLK